MTTSKNTFNTKSTLTVNDTQWSYYAINGGELAGNDEVKRLPVSIKILLENLLRHEDELSCSRDDILALMNSGGKASQQEIAYHPARVLMQDFTGVPAVVDLAAMRDALVKRSRDPQAINPLSPVDLVIDHSVSIDSFGSDTSFAENVEIEMKRNLGGGYTRLSGQQQPMFIYHAAMDYMARELGTVIIAGKEYGTGSSRDWAAKGTLLLGIKAVIVESFERIHRSNLVGMGVLPLQFIEGDTRKTLQLTGDETFDILDLDKPLTANQKLPAVIHYPSGESRNIQLQSRLDTAVEVEYYLAGGVLRYVLDNIVARV